MSAKTLHDTVLSGSIGNLLDALNDAEAHIGRQEVSFPRIAVLGDESAGKSSLLESLCKIPFPRGANLTTKCPTQIRLRRKAGAKWSARAWTADVDGDQRNHETIVQAPEDITRVVENLQNAELQRVNAELRHHKTNFANGPITISIEADDVVDLTLVDLPGYIQRTGLNLFGNQDDVDRSEKEVTRVANILEDYIKDDRTVLLVVLQLGTQFKTVGILNLLEKYKKRLHDKDKIQRLNSRIIYCVTKCDEYPEPREPPQDVEDLLRNQGIFVSKPYGWYFVINNAESPPENQDFETRIAAYRAFETRFFDDNAPYRNPVHRKRCGTDNLLFKLTKVLESEIHQNLREMLSQTDGILSSAREELKQLGPPPREPECKEREFFGIVKDIKKFYEEVCDGVYGTLRAEAKISASDISDEDLERCKFGYKKTLRFEIFKRDIEKTCPRFNDSAYLSRLEQRVKEARSGEMDGTVPIPKVLFDEIRDCILPWKDLAETLCEDIASYAIACLNIIVDIKSGKYKKLPSVIKVFLHKLIQEQKKNALLRLRWNYVDERVRPNSLNVSWVEEVVASEEKIRKSNGSQRMELGTDQQTIAFAYVTRLKAYLPLAQKRYIDNVVRTVSTHILDVPRGEVLTKVEEEKEPNFVFEGSEILKGEDLDDVMKVRDDLEQKREAVTNRREVIRSLREALNKLTDDTPKDVPDGVANGVANGFANGVGNGAL